ncbi:ABC-2 type transport system ATP-binding protein [Arthrobacter sp. JUb119]|uniref:ABC transporter ATP-binding protein n=1 Tax=Micrococcaceae TaxID=1268 RepID=UPI000CFB906B|nr:ATP-binding cassette domain-containing protein [Arthrobacter sp. MYb222]MCS3493843.1 ABC-2 type transport system ATP-binding protein [Arthrobacter sp. JUb119]PQZ89799.1 multidrug ABC transporter ATP-binding protein [Arthrobacter sp. MYb222]
MITASGLTKSFGGKNVVREVDLNVDSGQVLGFIGPNGSGKTTTLRMLVGLCRPDAGSALLNGVPVPRMTSPLKSVGVLIDAAAPFPGRTAFEHLYASALASGLRRSRVLAVLEEVGLLAARNTKIKHLSLGMRQRLSLGVAFVASPRILILDEPLNGLDPEGIRWFRDLVNQWRSEGRTVLISSHLMSELSPIVDKVAVIKDGAIVFQGSVKSLNRVAGEPGFILRSEESKRLRTMLDGLNIGWKELESETTLIQMVDIKQVARLAAEASIPMYEICWTEPSLEQAYFSLTTGMHNASV